MKIVFEGTNYSLESINDLNTVYPEANRLTKFIADWLNNQTEFEFQTSGSTGLPKPIKVSRKQILASVNATTEFLKLKRTQSALVCLDPNFIASLMMVARCLINDMDVILQRPSSNPLKTLKQKINFASFVPMQINKMIEEGNIDALSRIDNILIGGAPMSSAAFDRLTQIDANIYATYGMTETVSHIALMPIKGLFTSAFYEVLQGIQIDQDDDGCLKISGAVTNSQLVQTNDIVEMIAHNKFRWVGRRDAVINSGGIKIHPEQLEKVIESLIESPFIISWKSNEALGSECLLLSERATISKDQLRQIQFEIEEHFSKYHIPKTVLTIDQFKRTDSGKIQREETRKLALGLS